MNLNIPKPPLPGNGAGKGMDMTALIGQAVAQLLATLAGMQDAMEDLADAMDEMVWLTEERAIKDGIVTRDDIDKHSKEEEEETDEPQTPLSPSVGG